MGRAGEGELTVVGRAAIGTGALGGTVTGPAAGAAGVGILTRGRGCGEGATGSTETGRGGGAIVGAGGGAIDGGGATALIAGAGFGAGGGAMAGTGGAIEGAGGGTLRDGGGAIAGIGGANVEGGGAIAAGAGAFAEGGGAIAGLSAANCLRTNWVTNSDASTPQVEQTKCTGWCAISGVTSNVYFAPQEHWSFMMAQGFNNTTPCVRTREKAELGGLACT